MSYIPALAQAGGALLGGALGAQGASAQAAAQKKIYKKQLGFAKDIYGKGVSTATTALPQQQQYLTQAEQAALGYQSPYLALGTQGANALAGTPEELQAAFLASPEYRLNYQAMLDQANQGVNSLAAAPGGTGYNSGARLQALAALGPRILNPLFSDFINRLKGYVGTGQTAAGTSSQLAGNLGINQASTLGSYVRNITDLGRGVVEGTNPAFAGMAGAAGAGAAAPYYGAGAALTGAANPLGQIAGQYFTPQPAGYTGYTPNEMANLRAVG